MLTGEVVKIIVDDGVELGVLEVEGLPVGELFDDAMEEGLPSVVLDCASANGIVTLEAQSTWDSELLTP